MNARMMREVEKCGKKERSLTFGSISGIYQFCRWSFSEEEKTFGNTWRVFQQPSRFDNNLSSVSRVPNELILWFRPTKTNSKRDSVWESYLHSRLRVLRPDCHFAKQCRFLHWNPTDRCAVSVSHPSVHQNPKLKTDQIVIPTKKLTIRSTNLLMISFSSLLLPVLGPNRISRFSAVEDMPAR